MDEESQTVYPHAVLPGFRVPCLEVLEEEQDTENAAATPARKLVKLGPGLYKSGDVVRTTKAGMLHHNPSGNAWWVDSDQKRYVPSASENVVGIITHRTAEGYRVDIGAAHPAVVSMLAFEGASKRNRPNVEVGDLLYARIVLANKDMDPEIECVNHQHKAAGYGKLNGGAVAHVSLKTCRAFMMKSNPIIAALEKQFTFEMATGMNGRVWIKGSTDALTVRLVELVEAGAATSDMDAFRQRIKGTVAALKLAAAAAAQARDAADEGEGEDGGEEAMDVE
ncbi:hypothetical protein BC828DRAFT_418320 [Blastocladiella britannica]|nr:hypothetical protein BC828DRAFT_418320 [Blastocladiella britannica]